MRILVTEVQSNLTQIMVTQALKMRGLGKKIYYIVPSSLSFEKEREVLEQRKILEVLGDKSETAIFDILVTRFKQLPYYFETLNGDQSDKINLSTIGVSMLFRKVLNQMENLEKYEAVKKTPGFIEKLASLYEEMVTGNLTSIDLPDRELAKILAAFERESAEKFQGQDAYQRFISSVKIGHFDKELSQSIFLISGFTRFSAQEEDLIKELSSKSQVIVGTYATEHAVKHGKNTIGIYKASMEMVDRLGGKVEFVKQVDSRVKNIYSELTTRWDQENDFTLKQEGKSVLQKLDKNLEIWQAENMMAEIEAVAQRIRQGISRGEKFKNFTVLVGDREAYHLPIRQVFSQYKIPYFYSRSDAMRDHPLIVFFDSLLAIKQKNYRQIDVMSLLKTGLYTGNLKDLQELDELDLVSRKYQIQGRKKFTQFTPEKLKLQEELLSEGSPLDNFLSSRAKKTGHHLKALIKFLEKGSIPINLAKLVDHADYDEQDRYLQVWHLFRQTLEEFEIIFSDQEMTVTEFLDILVTGFKNANFRQVPSKVDTVQVRDYELVEPGINQYVFGIGLTQSNFPRVKKNTSLISDQDRIAINEGNSEQSKFLEDLTKLNHSKYLFTAASLLNSANQRLILSRPQIFENKQDENSQFIAFLEGFDFPVRKIYQLDPRENLKLFIQNLSTFEMQVEKENAPTSLNSSHIYDDFKPSVSSFQDFYTCQYKFYLEKALDLKVFEVENAWRPDVIGNYFHQVLELTLAPSGKSQTFDERLTESLHKVDREYRQVSEFNQVSRFIHQNLKETLMESGQMIKTSLKNFSIIGTEEKFQNFRMGDFSLNGKIDRLDSLNGKLGAIDYKSGASAAKFDIKKAYEGLGLQLLTYLDYLNNIKETEVWGALYLHLQNPIINTSDLSALSALPRKLLEKMQYQGILVGSLPETTSFGYIKQVKRTKTRLGNTLEPEEFNALIHHNRHKFDQGMKVLRSGNLSIQPIAEKGINADTLNVSGCQYCPFKSICRFEATRHPVRQMTKMTGLEILDQLRKEMANE